MAAPVDVRHWCGETEAATPSEACAVAHGEAPAETPDRTLVAVFASPVARYLLAYGADLGYRTVT